MHCSRPSFVTVMPSALISPLMTAISSVFSAVRASPFANAAIACTCLGEICTFWLPKPDGWESALFKSLTRSFSSSAFNTKTRQRESRAALISKDGFSVVAPIRMMLPFSTKGRNASCCALLKRWISSTKRTVRIPMRRLFSAWFMTSLISLIPLVTALKLIKSAFVCPAMILARVVFPTPGGPQNIMEEIWSRSMSCLSIFPFPSRCSCPTKFSRESGRSRLARGAVSLRSSNNVICSIVKFSFVKNKISGYILKSGEMCKSTKTYLPIHCNRLKDHKRGSVCCSYSASFFNGPGTLCRISSVCESSKIHASNSSSFKTRGIRS